MAAIIGVIWENDSMGILIYCFNFSFIRSIVIDKGNCNVFYPAGVNGSVCTKCIVRIDLIAALLCSIPGVKLITFTSTRKIRNISDLAIYSRLSNNSVRAIVTVKADCVFNPLPMGVKFSRLVKFVIRVLSDWITACIRIIPAIKHKSFLSRNRPLVIRYFFASCGDFNFSPVVREKTAVSIKSYDRFPPGIKSYILNKGFTLLNFCTATLCPEPSHELIFTISIRAGGVSRPLVICYLAVGVCLHSGRWSTVAVVIKCNIEWRGVCNSHGFTGSCGRRPGRGRGLCRGLIRSSGNGSATFRLPGSIKFSIP